MGCGDQENLLAVFAPVHLRTSPDDIHLHGGPLEPEPLRGLPDGSLPKLLVGHLREPDRLHADIAPGQADHAPPAREPSNGKRSPQLLRQTRAIFGGAWSPLDVEACRPHGLWLAAVLAKLQELDRAGAEVDADQSNRR